MRTKALLTLLLLAGSLACDSAAPVSAEEPAAEKGNHVHTAHGIEKVVKTDEEWKKILTPEQYQVLRKHSTERAGTSPLNLEKRPGTFICAGCGENPERSPGNGSGNASGTSWTVGSGRCFGLPSRRPRGREESTPRSSSCNCS